MVICGLDPNLLPELRDSKSASLGRQGVPISGGELVPVVHGRAPRAGRRGPRLARKKVEMLFAHLKRLLGLTHLRLRGPNGAKDEFLMATTVQNLRQLAMTLPAPS